MNVIGGMIMYYIGVDLGGTNIAVGIIDESGKLLCKKSVPTLAQRGEDAIIEDIAKTVKEIVSENGFSMEDIKNVGIGSPGSVDSEKGVVITACNLNFKNTFLKQKLEKLLEKDVFVDNDANCAAWGEAMAGVSKGTHSSVMVTLGTGVGGGIIVDNKIVSGFNFFGGELGHIIIEASGKMCPCGRQGCWEAYSSASALINLTKQAMEENPDSIIKDIVEANGKVSGKTAFEAARKGDKVGQAVVDEYIKYLTIGIYNVITIFQPEVVVVGGGVSNEGDGLFVPLTEMVNKLSYISEFLAEEKKTKVLKASLGNDAGIIGAALLGINK